MLIATLYSVQKIGWLTDSSRQEMDTIEVVVLLRIITTPTLSQQFFLTVGVSSLKVSQVSIDMFKINAKI